MVTERNFIKQNIKRMLLREYIKSTIERAGFGGIDVKRHPMGTKIKLVCERPGMIIGKKGRTIKELTDTLEKKFEIENPQIEVEDVKSPNLNPHIMAYKLANAIERGWHFRRAGHSTLRRIMESGARGAQIVIAGKLTGQRHRTEKFKQGHIKFCGDTKDKWMREGRAIVKKKLGLVGIKVQIMVPNAKLPDEVEILDREKWEIKKVELQKEKELAKEKEEEAAEAVKEFLKNIKAASKTKKKTKKRTTKKKSKKKAEESKESAEKPGKESKKKSGKKVKEEKASSPKPAITAEETAIPEAKAKPAKTVSGKAGAKEEEASAQAEVPKSEKKGITKKTKPSKTKKASPKKAKKASTKKEGDTLKTEPSDDEKKKAPSPSKEEISDTEKPSKKEGAEKSLASSKDDMTVEEKVEKASEKKDESEEKNE